MIPSDLRNIHHTGNVGTLPGTHFHAQPGTKTIPVFLADDRETSWFLVAGSVSLLSGGTVQPENTYFYIIKVTSISMSWDLVKQ